MTSQHPLDPGEHVKVLLPEEHTPSSIPILCNLKHTVFPFGVDSLSSTIEMRPGIPSLASPKGEMESPFSWTNFVKNPTSSTLCFGEPTLAKLNQEQHLQRSTKSSCCVKLSLASPSLHLFHTANSLLVSHTEFLSATPTN